MEEKNLELVRSLARLKVGDPVIYYPDYMQGKPITNSQLGIVSSLNDTYAFVKYDGTDTAQATKPTDIYLLYHRPDLMSRIPNFEVKPFNRTCELWIEQQDALKE